MGNFIVSFMRMLKEFHTLIYSVLVVFNFQHSYFCSFALFCFLQYIMLGVGFLDCGDM